MKRKIGIYILLIAVIVGAAPYLVGFLVENRFKEVVHAVSEIDSVNVAILEYHRGWRKSHAKTRVTFHGDVADKLASNLKSGSKELSVMIAHDIRHGPFVQLKDGNYADWSFALADIQSALSLTDGAKKELEAIVGDTQILTMHSEITMDGTTKAKLNGKELKIKDGVDEHILWKGFSGEWELSRDYKRLEGSMLMPGFDAHVKKGRIIGEDLVFKTERFKTPEELWLGTAKLDLQKLQVNEENKEYFTMTGFAASGVTDTENGMIESSGTLRIEAIQVKGKVFGPVNYSGSIKNIAPMVMKSFLDTTRAMQTASVPEQEKYAQQLMALGPEFLKSRPILQIDDISIRTPQGDMKANFTVAVGGPEAFDTSNMQQIIQSIVANGKVVLPKALIQELLGLAMHDQTKTHLQHTQPNVSDETFAQELNRTVDEIVKKEIEQGLWVDQGNLLTMEFAFKEGRLLVNGKPLDLMKLLFEAKTPAMTPPQPAPQ